MPDFQDFALLLLLIGVVYLIFSNTTLFAKTKKWIMTTVTIKVDKNELDSSNIKKIQTALGLQTSELKKALEKMAKSAFLEYCNMIGGSGTPEKMESIRQERLFLLMEHFFTDRFPTESEINAIFHLGLARSKTLLQNTISTYRTTLVNYNKYLLYYLDKAQKDSTGDFFQFECSSQTIILELNGIVRTKWSGLQLVSKVKSTASTYECHKDTYKELKTFLNL